jgi:hypothetical protein
MQLASEDDESTRLSCPPGSLLMPHVIEVPLTLLFIEHVESKVKKLGPDRGGGGRTKRERSSPYKHPKKTTKDSLKAESENVSHGGTIKYEDQVLKDDGW